MITRIEIDGFKSFLDFKLDVPPFLALVGPNASGKSNLFDALDYVREESVLEARRGRPHELFHRAARGESVARFEITVDVLVASEHGSTFLRGAVGASVFDDSNVVPVYLSRSRPVVSRFQTIRREPADDGWRAEVSSWRFHLPDPGKMRSAGSTADTRALTENGENLAAVLGRLKGTEALDDITVDFVSLVPDVVGIDVTVDERRQEWSFDVIVDGQGPIPSTVLSDGTLRILGLLTALHDPAHSGVLMIEEIENGLHPSRLAELLRRIRQRVSDPESEHGPLRQVILTSHSPVLVSELYRLSPESLVFMDTAVRVDPGNERVSRVTVAKPIRGDGDHRERGKAEKVAARCAVDVPVITVVPVRETEAWLLADTAAWAQLRGSDTSVLPKRPRDVEKIADPKRVLDQVVQRRDRDRRDYFEFIGRNISLDVLAEVPAYVDWVSKMTTALKELKYL